LLPPFLVDFEEVVAERDLRPLCGDLARLRSLSSTAATPAASAFDA
jgi:hypothetical protein